MATLDFNPHPHTEGDAAEVVENSLDFVISIHTLTRRVTFDNNRGCPRVTNFNPHPHTEGDLTIPWKTTSPMTFQSTPSHGG